MSDKYLYTLDYIDNELDKFINGSCDDIDLKIVFDKLKFNILYEISKLEENKNE